MSNGHKIVWSVAAFSFLVIVFIIFAQVGKNTEEPEVAKPDVETEEPEAEEPEGAVETGEQEETEEPAAGDAEVEAVVKQHKPYEFKVAPAFTADELTALPKSDWLTNGGNLSNQRYSPLDQINTSNVGDLKGEWVANLGSGFDFKYSGEASPVVYDGVMYVITGANDVLALDAVTGETIWEYRPHITDKLTTVCCGWTSRGVAVGEGLVFVGLLDARLVALDQTTGEVVWETVVDDWRKGYTITNAPLYYNGKVYTGVSGGEYGIRGRLTAFDAEMGRELWRFNTIPGPGEKGHETWPSDNKAWMSGGAPVWQTPAVDPELGLMYFSTGNTAPDLDGSSREGDNLYSDSVIALDPETGEYKWHFQQVHHDIWDLDSPNPIILFDVEIDGEPRKGLGQAGKTGWIYFLDRTNGEPLIGIEETPVPQEERQKTSPTQPIPKGDSFVPQDITPEDIERDMSDAFEGEYGGIFTPFWEEPLTLKPSPFGGANWPPSAYNPNTEYFYVLGTDQYMAYTRSDEEFNPDEIEEGHAWVGSIMAPVTDAPVRGTITAMDVKTNTVVWQQVWDSMAYSGAMTTKGNLLFVGHNDGRFIAYDATTGDQLWEFMTDAGVNAPPITYEIDGKQYITVFAAGNSLAGSKHGDSVWTFSLDGEIESVDDVVKPADAAVEDGETGEEGGSDETLDDEENDAVSSSEGQTESGSAIYEANCLACHGTEGANGHNGPNLQTSSIAPDKDAVMKRVKEGGESMPSFEGTLTEQEIDDVAAYISEIIANLDE
ncbi:PQQ-binding-like beta-propeller repeat protein [Oceanobacillus massiliensis]|uniref:outer membrane protein assembly factor BamB family protein n=1 Tax=Oceanobacillus massiliensis TaxID=1465765 RepID=UPI000288726A|nr:PQQ-binding-like beta-propeller repeat protein [Oceanobacillus massiliensis]